jgi:riboflavin biosynthesis pyrimidine reductase
MNDLTPLVSLFDMEHGRDLPLPPDLATLYGRLAFPPHRGRAHVVGNFVTTLDGVVTLNEPGHASGGDISEFNRHDQVVMGLLRAVADAVIVGAGTLGSVPQHRWTAQYIYPLLADVYRQLRISLGKKASPLNVIVTAHGEVDLQLPVFQSGEVPVLLITMTQGAERIRAQPLPPDAELQAIQSTGSVSARAILQAVNRVRQGEMILVEDGPQLLGDFFAERLLAEMQQSSDSDSSWASGLPQRTPSGERSRASNAQGAICFCAMPSRRKNMCSAFYPSMEAAEEQ